MPAACVCVPASPGCRRRRRRPVLGAALPQPRGRTGGAERAAHRRAVSGAGPLRPTAGPRLPLVGFGLSDTRSPREGPPAAAFGVCCLSKGKFEHPSARSPHPTLPQRLTRGAAALCLQGAVKTRPKAPLSSFPSITDCPPVFSAAEVTFP
ncbi:unnamed protein product [Coccothraustes coccothraustes]